MQLRIIDAPLIGLYPIPIDNANALLTEWGHTLGPVHRPYGQEAYGLETGGVGPRVAGHVGVDRE